MSGAEKKFIEDGKKFLAKGDKELKRITIFSLLPTTLAGFFTKLFSNAEERKDNAKEDYQKAANCFKLAKQCWFFRHLTIQK